MADVKTGKSSKGKEMHYSVGVVIKKNEKYLLVDRRKKPLGFAGVAGHVDEGENETHALIREIKEESGLKVKSYRLIFEEEVEGNVCRRGVEVHYWWLYKVDAEGKLRLKPDEAKSIGWYSAEEIKKLKLEPVWEYWFKKLGVI